MFTIGSALKMSENLLDGLNPVTQTIDGGKALAKFLGLSEELPETIALANGARLVLSTKRDCYYFTSEKGCTCKAGRGPGDPQAIAAK